MGEARPGGSSSDALIRAAWIATAIVFTSVALPYTRYPFAGEHGVYSYGAWRLLGGAVPYRDFWDNNAPGIFAIHALAESVFGHGMAGIRWLDLVWMGATLALLHAVTEAAFGRLAAVLGVLFAVLHYFTLGHQPTAQRDGFCVLPILVMMGAAMHPARSVRAERLAALSIGAATAMVFWIKPPLALVGGVCAVARLLGPGPRVQQGVALAAGFLVPSGLVLAWFAANGALFDLFESVVRFNAVYAQTRLPFLDELRALGNIAALDPILIAGIAGLAIARGRAGRVFAAVVAACLAVVLLQGKLLGYHLVPLRILLCAGAGNAAARLLQAQRRSTPAAIGAALVLFVALWSFTAAFRAQHFAELWSKWLQGRAVAMQREDSQLAKRLATQTSSDETLLVWGVGTAGIVNYLAERVSPTRFVTNYPFSLPEPDPDLVRGWRAQFLAELLAAPPRFVIVASGDAWPAIGNLDSAASFERFAALRDFVAARYEPAEQLEGRLRYRIYRRKD